MLSDKEFIELGYTYTNVSASRVFQEMWNQVLTEDYIDDIKGSKPVKYPSWEGSSTFDDRLIEDSTLAECPHWKVSDRYWTTFGGIPDQYRNFVGWLIIHIGVTPKRIDCMLHNTLMGYTNPWHNHHLDESPLNILVHMGTRNRTDKDGGRLELGKISAGRSAPSKCSSRDRSRGCRSDSDS